MCIPTYIHIIDNIHVMWLQSNSYFYLFGIKMVQLAAIVMALN